MHKRALAALTALLLTSACATVPPYETPEPPQTAAGNFVTHVEGTDPTTPLPADWWKLYNDPVLDNLVARALEANTDLRVASANLARANAIAREARAGRLPTTDVTGGVSYGDAVQGGQGGSGGAQWSGNGGLAVAWEVDLFGRVNRAIAAAEADAAAVEAARDAVRVAVVAETTRAYFNACSFAYSASIARESHDISNRTLELVQAQAQAGTVGRLEVERAAGATATARSAIPGLEGQRQSALFELAALLGATPAEVPEAARVCMAPPQLVADLPVGDGAQLLRRRPDLRQAERQLAADTARIGVAVADLYPRISLGGSGNFFRNDQVQGADSFSFSLGPLLSWSFPNMAVGRARVSQAEAQGDASLAAFDGQVVTALKEVEQALVAVSAELATNDALFDAQSRAEEAYRLADLRYRAGAIAYLDLLSTQADLTASRASYAASMQRLAAARVDLFKALGGGW